MNIKATYLGSWLENDMTMGALARLNDALMYRVVSAALEPNLFPCEDLFTANQVIPIDERKTKLRAAFDEFTAIALDLIERAMDANGGDAAKALRAVYSNPDTDEKAAKALADILPLLQLFHPSNADEVKTAQAALSRTTMPLAWQMQAARTPLDCLLDRVGKLADDHIGSTKSGAVLSQANADALREHRDAVARIRDDADELHKNITATLERCGHAGNAAIEGSIDPQAFGGSPLQLLTGGKSVDDFVRDMELRETERRAREMGVPV